MNGLIILAEGVEEYRGQKYKLERREIVSFFGANRKVWCWTILDGPMTGIFGGKCGTKREARKWARNAIRNPF